jgi:mannosyltransferase OCH1-like enzyme
LIPRTFHTFWVGPPMPERFRTFMEGWRRLHPDWSLRLWGGGDVPPLHNQELYDRAAELCPGFEGQLRSDVVRYELLLQYGGVWIDTDFQCYAPIDDLCDVPCFAAWERQGTVVNNAILGCEPGDPFMLRLVANLHASVTSGRSARPSKVSGPHYLTAQYRGHEAELTVYPQAWFYAVRCDELDRLGEPRRPGERARHWWANQHRLRSKPLVAPVSLREAGYDDGDEILVWAR